MNSTDGYYKGILKSYTSTSKTNVFITNLKTVQITTLIC